MSFKKRPHELRKTIAEANSQETATVYGSLTRERVGDGGELKTVNIKGTTTTVQQPTASPTLPPPPPSNG